MALRAVKHKFTGAHTPIASYDATKTNLGTLMVQNPSSGSTYLDNYAGPLPVGLARPMQEVAETVGTVAVATTAVTGTLTNFTATMVKATSNGMSIGFGSNDPAKIATWYDITVRGSALGVTISPSIGATPIAAGTNYVVVFNIPMMFPHVITFSATIDWVFLIENSIAGVAPRRISFYEYHKDTSAYVWKGFIIFTFTVISVATVRGFRALRYLHITGTASTNGTDVHGSDDTTWQKDGLAEGARIGFGSTDPTLIVNWYVISTITDDHNIIIAPGAGIQAAGPYVIEELRFAILATNATVGNGGLRLIKGINYSDFTFTGTTSIPIAAAIDNKKAVYWLSDAGTTVATNVVTNISGCGCAVASEVNKGLHYAYVIDGTGSTFVRVLRYNLRAAGTITAGKMLMSIVGTTAGTVTVSAGTTITCAGATPFTIDMIGMKIGFGSNSPAMISTWYTIVDYTSTSVITINADPGVVNGANYIIDSADVVSTATQLVTGTISAVNNGRVGTLHHGPGKDIESLYFVTTTRIYRAAISNIFAGNLAWISDNRPEIPPGSVNSYLITGALSVVEIADTADRLIVLSTCATALRCYVTRYPAVAGECFDHIWGIDDKQQDQISACGSAYFSAGTVTVVNGVVTNAQPFFTAAMVGFRIGFGNTNPTLIANWYTIGTYTSTVSITLTDLTVGVGAGSAYVIDWNTNTYPHFTTCTQPVSVWSENGIAHLVKHGTTAALSQMYALPLSAHWTFAANTNQRIITPALYTPDCAEFQRVIVTNQNRFGSGEFSISPEPFRLYFRTKGIDYNTGEWTLVGRDGDLSGLSGSRFIQFMFEFVTIGWFNIPARIFSLSVIYDDTMAVTDSHYQPSVAKSDVVSKRFAWRFAAAFGGDGTVPTLRVRLYNAITGDLLMDDYTVASKGAWDKSTDGNNWLGAYNTAGKTNETTYISYTPASLGDNIKVRAVLTQ